MRRRNERGGLGDVSWGRVLETCLGDVSWGRVLALHVGYCLEACRKEDES